MQTIVITGANRGIGLALTQAYCEQGHKVIAVCRQSSEELDKTTAITVAGVELANLPSLYQQLSSLPIEGIDLLINNAGILADESLGNMNFHQIQQQFQINAIAPLAVVDALNTRLNHGAKVAMITSRMGSIADNSSGGRYGYRMSKAALNAASKSLANDLGERQISVAIIHPGYVQTEMVGGRGDISAATAAEGIQRRIEHLELDNSGSFWHANGQLLPW